MKAAFFGILWWILIFVEVSAIGFTPGLATRGPSGLTLLPPGVALHFAALIGFTLLLAKFYFRGGDEAPSHPLFTAAIIVLVGLGLDALITVPLFVKNYLLYFQKWTLWMGVIVFAATFYAAAKMTQAKSP